MGLAIEQERFDAADYPRFVERLERSLVALRALLERPAFGEGEPSIGAELELSLVDEQGAPLQANRQVLDETADPRVTVELDRFNLECNLRPGPLAGRPFSALGAEIDGALAEVRRAAARHAGRVATIGILPTLAPQDLQTTAMTDVPRYRALSAALQRLRSEPFRVRIDGKDPLEIECDDVTFEGAATSLQLHLRVAPSRFADVYNAVQLATGPALAVAGNSPTFLGHRLWHETRVALFKQAVDARRDGAPARREPRVSFGKGWCSGGAFELFAENVALHEPLLPVLGDERPIGVVRSGGVPRLDEMRLHQSTVWRWNRAIYDPVDGGHLRIEMRAFPAGPTTRDMLAHTAFLIGLALGLAPDVKSWLARFPFAAAESNFYRAAQYGIDAELLWPVAPKQAPEPQPAAALVRALLPIAERGLAEAGVASEDSGPLLDCIADRCAARQTGAVWQQRALAALAPRLGPRAALTTLLERYLAHVASGAPVHAWPVEEA